MTAVAAHDDGAKAKDVLDRSDARWLRLQEIIRAHSSQRRQSHSCNGVNQWHHSRRHLNLTGSRSCCDLESSCAMKAARSEREVIRLRTSPRELWLVRSSLVWVAPITPYAPNSCPCPSRKSNPRLSQ